MDSEAILRVDMGFYISTASMGPIQALMKYPMSFWLTRNIDRSSYEVAKGLATLAARSDEELA